MFDAKLKKRIAELEELVAVNESMIDGLTEEQHRLVAFQNATLEAVESMHKHDKDAWKAAMALKEALWEKERARLEGMVEVLKAKAALYDEMTLPFGQWANGGYFIHQGKEFHLVDYRTGDPAITLKHAYPKGKEPM